MFFFLMFLIDHDLWCGDSVDDDVNDVGREQWCAHILHHEDGDSGVLYHVEEDLHVDEEDDDLCDF